ncbi:MAG: MCE family protein [Fibrobacter sp.]|nr:MCE family protein [Fibrobacter sp.]
MNNVAYKIRRNIIPLCIAIVLLVGICGAWFLYHPSSPYHKRMVFVVSFEKIGTLMPGNRVAVRGISCGQVLKVELAEDAVYVTAEVLASTKIPRNSQFRLITAGLMGERELNVLSGDGKEYVADGDTVKGFYEEGASGITKGLREILADIRELRVELEKTDSTVIQPMDEQIMRVGRKANRLAFTVASRIKGWRSSFDSLMGDCSDILTKVKTDLDEVATKGDDMAEKAKPMLPRVKNLIEKTKSLQGAADELAKKIEADDNSVGLFLAEKGKLSQELDRTAADIDALIEDLKKQGLKLNVDIF